VEGSGTVLVPEGTTFTQYTGLGNSISDALGNAIETGGDLSAFEGEMTGAQSFLPGAEVPNYSLYPPEGLNIMGNPVTVTEPTLLSDILQPGLGHVQWAACCVVIP
jgi:Putative adhesin Stv domain